MILKEMFNRILPSFVSSPETFGHNPLTLFYIFLYTTSNSVDLVDRSDT